MTMPESAAAESAAFVAQRVAMLTKVFRAIGETRMQGVPVLHPALCVEAIAFETVDNGAFGILITPWFMNLMWLPFNDAEAVPAGSTCVRELGGERLEFIGALETSFGAYEMCSLFSPMLDFADQDAARETAGEVLRLLRKSPPKPDVPLAPSRRAFITGRVGKERT
jgi:[NiFe] hydrogenase assembly HybE family chaperone